MAFKAAVIKTGMYASSSSLTNKEREEEVFRLANQAAHESNNPFARSILAIHYGDFMVGFAFRRAFCVMDPGHKARVVVVVGLTFVLWRQKTGQSSTGRVCCQTKRLRSQVGVADFRFASSMYESRY